MDVQFEFSKLVRRVRSITQESSVLVRYSFAVVTVLVAVGLRFAFSSFLGTGGPYRLFGLAVIFSTLLGGVGPGLTAIVLSALAVDRLFLGPLHSPVLARPAAVWGLVLFVVTSVLLAWLMGVIRKSLLRLATTEEALRQQGHLIELSQDAIITMDSERRIITWNKGAEEMFGWSETDAVGKAFRQLVQTVGSIPLTEIDEILHREGRWGGELSRTARDGRRLVVDSRQVLIRGENGLPTRILAISRDITEHRRAEEALRESEAQFRTLADAIPRFCWTANADGWASWFNQRSYEYTGATPEQMEGWGWQSVIDPEVLSKVLERWRHSVATGEPFEMVFPVRAADGSFRHFLGRVMPVRDREGKVTRWFGTSTDISEQRRTENALRESEERLRLAQQVARLGTFEWNIQTGVDRWTPELEALYGLPPGGFAGTEQAWEELVYPADRAEAVGRVQRALATGATADAEYRVIQPDGSVRWLFGRARVFKDDSGNPLRMIGVNMDITERKQAEERLRQVQKLESIGLLAGGIAHDFNNLLTVIMGRADFELTKNPSNEGFQHIITASERAAHLTSQLLAYAGKGQFISKTVNLSDLVSRSTPLLSASIPKTVNLVFRLSQEDLFIKADPSQIEQILKNLVINAAESIASQTDGRIEIVTGSSVVLPEMAGLHEPALDVRPGHFVSLEVTDNGSGMDEATMAQIFDPFFSTKFTGRGLGLAAVQGILRSCHGFIDVRSSPGAGSTFRVYLPAVAPKPAAEIPADARPGALRRPVRSPAAILVVDDEDMVRQSACIMLRRLGYQVLEAKDGKGTLEVLARAVSPPSLALVDLTMPVMGGDDVVPILNRDYPGLRIIVTSGYPEEDALRAFPPGVVDGFLPKPYSMATLTEKVEETLRGGGGPNEEMPAAA